ncbi:MAG: hypothetical protein K2N23_06070 [Clostridia bacterium]|nr:hypothetical protein [Clostridia bacterium]
MQENTDNIPVLPMTDDEQRAMLKKRDKLPKFTLGKHEDFYISNDTLTKLTDSYNQMLSDMQESTAGAKSELRAYMESVIYTSYVCQIAKKQRENRLECEVEHMRQDMLESITTPRRWRNWYWPFKLHRNQAAILLDELVSRQARAYFYKKESELPILEEESEEELEPYAVQLEMLRAYLPRMRKKKRAILEEIISGLAVSYESKEAKLQRLNAELQEERAKVEELTAEAKKEAVKRLITCLNAVKEAKKPADWEILKLREQLEKGKPAEEPVKEKKPSEADEETDEIENCDDLEKLEEEDGDEAAPEEPVEEE